MRRVLTCVFDSPVTWQREAWQDGRLVASAAAELLLSRAFCGHRMMFFALNCGPWDEGRCRGDSRAMDERLAEGAQG
jgi:hypothetical protein